MVSSDLLLKSRLMAGSGQIAEEALSNLSLRDRINGTLVTLTDYGYIPVAPDILIQEFDAKKLGQIGKQLITREVAGCLPNEVTDSKGELYNLTMDGYKRNKDICDGPDKLYKEPRSVSIEVSDFQAHHFERFRQMKKSDPNLKIDDYIKNEIGVDLR